MDSLAVNKRMSDNTENEIVGRRTDDICETLATSLAAFKAQETFDEAEEAVLPCSARERCQYSESSIRRKKMRETTYLASSTTPQPGRLLALLVFFLGVGALWGVHNTYNGLVSTGLVHCSASCCRAKHEKTQSRGENYALI